MVRLAVVLQAAMTALALGGALLLVVASVGHLVHFDQLRAVVIGQQIVPYRAHRMLAGGLVVVELVVGAGVLVAVLAVPAGARPALAAETAVYVVLLGYLVLLRAVRPGAPCGCFAGEGPVSGAALVRAGVFAAAAGTALLVASPAPGAGSVPLSVAATTAGAVIATVARIAPRLAGTPGRSPARSLPTAAHHPAAAHHPTDARHQAAQRDQAALLRRN